MQHTEKNYYSIIATNIKFFRKNLNLSQESFAEKLDCSREFISRIENNKEKISLKMFLKICTTFKTIPEQFFQEPNL